MHQERILQLADYIRTQPHDPNMNLEDTICWDQIQTIIDDIEAGCLRPNMFRLDYWLRRTNCGTVGCIAGHTCYLFADECKEIVLRGKPLTIVGLATQLLQMDSTKAWELFSPDLPGVTYRHVTPTQAAHVLEQVASGEWPRIAWSKLVDEIRGF